MIFVDTSFWAALRLRDDRNHAAALRLYRRHADAGLVTSVLVQGETWTFLRRRRGHRSAVRFVDELRSSERVQIRPFPSQLEDTVWHWLRQHDEREYSYVDATSFGLMRHLGIREALAFDGDFSAAGFVELR